jgi:Proteasome subunit
VNLCNRLTTFRQTTENTRPFGVGLIVAGIDKLLGPQLYVLDSEGSINAWNAICIGTRSEKVMKSLTVSLSDILKKGDLSIADAWPIFQSSLREHFPSKDKALEADSDPSEERSLSPKTVRASHDGIIAHTSFDELPTSESVSEGIADDSDDYWELEATSMMINSANDVCITDCQFPSSQSLQNSTLGR